MHFICLSFRNKLNLARNHRTTVSLDDLFNRYKLYHLFVNVRAYTIMTIQCVWNRSFEYFWSETKRYEYESRPEV